MAFALMPNHFHLILNEREEGGIANYMQRILNGYTKYFNTKYKRSGHLFQGPYQAVHIKDNDQFLYTSAYVHRNCRTLENWVDKEKLFPWSTLQDYVTTDRWQGLIEKELIQEQFPTSYEYENWVATSGAKELDDAVEFD